MQVDTFMLANAAEGHDGMVSVLGGGWTRCWPDSGQAYPYQRSIIVVIGIRVESSETNVEHGFRLEIRDSEGIVLGPGQADGTFNVARDGDLSPGMSQLLQIAGALSVEIPSPGVYSIVLVVNGSEVRRIAFEALGEPPPSQA